MTSYRFGESPTPKPMRHVSVTISRAARFETELSATQLENGSWRLNLPLVYWSYTAHRYICAPAGFVTDFASVPRIPIAFWLFGNVAHKAAVIHDFLYRTQPEWVTRDLADEIFLEAMGASGVPAWRRYPMYVAVRAGGWITWNNRAESLVLVNGQLIGLAAASKRGFSAFVQEIADMRRVRRERMA